MLIDLIVSLVDSLLHLSPVLTYLLPIHSFNTAKKKFHTCYFMWTFFAFSYNMHPLHLLSSLVNQTKDESNDRWERDRNWM